ncbi:MAG: ABC transporter permease [Gammaproteobacteria bacterium]|nr:ABC transporter permease [Gammaproteobacteria bacterium]
MMLHRVAVVSAGILSLLFLFALSAPILEMILNTDASKVNLFSRYLPFSLQHPLGTDELGRDLLVRLAYGGRVSLLVGFTAAIIAAAIGTLIGLTAGYFGGWLDTLLMRTTDSVIALPLLPLLIVLAVIDLEKLGIPVSIANHQDIGLYRIIVIVSLVGWTGVARLVRGSVLSLRERPYIIAARAMGVPAKRIIFTHILPALISPITVATTLSVGNIILFESILSFLGLGINPPTPSWGNMLTNAQELIWEAPTLAFFPGMLIFITVLAFNFIGDGLQDALSPRAKKR